MNVIHTAVWVSDLDASKAYYMDALGLEFSREFTGDDGVVNYFVFGEDDTEIQFKYDPEGDGEVEPSGLDHIAIGVEDTDAVVEQMVEETGCRVVQEPWSDPKTGVRIAFVEDPDGYVLEILQPLE